MVDKILHRKPKIKHHEPHWKTRVNSGALVGSSCSTSGTCHITHDWYGINIWHSSFISLVLLTFMKLNLSFTTYTRLHITHGLHFPLLILIYPCPFVLPDIDTWFVRLSPPIVLELQLSYVKYSHKMTGGWTSFPSY